MTTSDTNKRGFTIIEVVLVLAIAALIFLMIFVALPALQRNQRDTARKNDAGIVAAAVSSYASNTRSVLGASDDAVFRTYIDALDQYDTDDVFVVDSNPSSDLESRLDEVYVITGWKCDNNTPVEGSRRTAAVVVVLENNGNDDDLIEYCQSA
jgi:prepilin-type N-terminal cleavage/methylation domain-containing protein